MDDDAMFVSTLDTGVFTFYFCTPIFVLVFVTFCISRQNASGSQCIQLPCNFTMEINLCKCHIWCVPFIIHIKIPPHFNQVLF